MQEEQKDNVSLTPYVIEDTGRGERSMDIYSRLLKDRIIFIGTRSPTMWPTWSSPSSLPQMEDPKKDIHVYINSMGGYITAGLAIYDTMQWLGCAINTYCIGQASSMGALLLTAGTKASASPYPTAGS